MIRLLTRERKQSAVYWGTPVNDGYGGATYDYPVAIDCRWEDLQELFIDPFGEEKLSKAVVYVGQDLDLGAWLLFAALSEVTIGSIGFDDVYSGSGGLDDLAASGDYTGSSGTSDSPSEYVVTMEAIKSGTVASFSDAGGGYTLVDAGSPHGISVGEDVVITNSVKYAGTYTIGVGDDVSSDTFKINIVFTGDDADSTTVWEVVNSFKWAKDGGTETTGVAITGAAQTLAEGVAITFTAKLGHTATDNWTMSVFPAESPPANGGFEIRQFAKIPTFDGTQYLRKCFL